MRIEQDHSDHPSVYQAHSNAVVGARAQAPEDEALVAGGGRQEVHGIACVRNGRANVRASAARQTVAEAGCIVAQDMESRLRQLPGQGHRHPVRADAVDDASIQQHDSRQSLRVAGLGRQGLDPHQTGAWTEADDPFTQHGSTTA
jgi:hypothetical protein